MELKNQDRRQHQRIDLTDTVVMNPLGVCEVIEMSTGGFSFKCIFEHNLSDIWMVDILNNSGVYLQQFPVEKIWETAQDDQLSTSRCGVEVGVRFKDLSPEQQETLDHLVLLNAPFNKQYENQSVEMIY